MLKISAFEKFILLLRTSRPIMWPIPVLLFFVGMKLAHALFTIEALVLLLFLLFPANLFIYGINDVYDYESDKINPRKKGVVGGVLHPRFHFLVFRLSLFLAGFFLAVSLTFGFFRGNLTSFFGVALILISGFVYSVPPIRLKTLPFLDSLTNVAIYYFGPFFMGWGQKYSLITLSPKVYILGIFVFGFHAFTTIFDYSVDKATGDRTSAVLLGKRITALVAATAFISPLILADFAYIGIPIFLVLACILALVIVICPSEKLAALFGWILFFVSVAVALFYIIFF